MIDLRSGSVPVEAGESYERVGEVPGAKTRGIAGADQPVNVRRPEEVNTLVLDVLSFRM